MIEVMVVIRIPTITTLMMPQMMVVGGNAKVGSNAMMAGGNAMMAGSNAMLAGLMSMLSMAMTMI